LPDQDTRTGLVENALWVSSIGARKKKLLGHTQASTTQRYAHLDADPLRVASEAIGGRIAAALDGKRGKVVAIRR
jgi:hypothetical protein